VRSIADYSHLNLQHCIITKKNTDKKRTNTEYESGQQSRSLTGQLLEALTKCGNAGRVEC